MSLLRHGCKLQLDRFEEAYNQEAVILVVFFLWTCARRAQIGVGGEETTVRIINPALDFNDQTLKLILNCLFSI